MIIAITGTPGTGKTQVAKLLAKKLKWKLVDLNKLAEKKKFYKGFDKERNCKIVDIKKLAKNVKDMDGFPQTSKKNLILEGHFSHDMPSDLVIVLRCNPRELRKRMAKRRWPKAKVEENIEAEIMAICREETREQGKRFLEIDTTEKKASDVVREIVNNLTLK